MSMLLHISETLDILFWKPKKSNVVLFFYSVTHLDRLDFHCGNLRWTVFDVSIDVMGPFGLSLLLLKTENTVAK